MDSQLSLALAEAPADETSALPTESRALLTALPSEPLDLSDASSTLVETSSALSLALREGDVEAAQRLFEFVTDQLADRRTAIADTLAAMMLRTDCSASLHPMSEPLLATCGAFLAGIRRPVSPAGRRGVLLYSTCGGLTPLVLQMSAVLLDEAHVPAQMQYGADAESLGKAAEASAVSAVAFGVADAVQAMQAEAVIRRLRRDGVSVVVVVDPLVAEPELCRTSGAAGVGWEPGPLSDLLLRLRGPLSAGEAEVLRFAADGFTNLRIAHELDISVSAVKARLEASYAKLQAADRAHAVAIAIRQRWIH